MTKQVLLTSTTYTNGAEPKAKANIYPIEYVEKYYNVKLNRLRVGKAKIMVAIETSCGTVTVTVTRIK